MGSTSQAVKRLLKILLVLLAVGVLLMLCFPMVTSYADSETRRSLLRMVARELPRDASTAEMAQFMQRHTTAYVLDQDPHFEYGAFVPHTAFDGFLGDRKVEIILIISRDTKTFQRADMRIFYTGP
jgi:hypothetical protein